MADTDFTEADRAHMRVIGAVNGLAQLAQVEMTPSATDELKAAYADLGGYVEALAPTSH